VRQIALEFIICNNKILKLINRRFLQNMMRRRNPGFETAMDGRMNGLIGVQTNGKKRKRDGGIRDSLSNRARQRKKLILHK